MLTFKYSFWQRHAIYDLTNLESSCIQLHSDTIFLHNLCYRPWTIQCIEFQNQRQWFFSFPKTTGTPPKETRFFFFFCNVIKWHLSKKCFLPPKDLSASCPFQSSHKQHSETTLCPYEEPFLWIVTTGKYLLKFWQRIAIFVLDFPTNLHTDELTTKQQQQPNRSLIT